MINSGRQKYWQLFAKCPKMSKIDKFLNHVFKTSKKTLSYSRTYCKIYKIENIGKIGQSAVGLKAKRVIYYGSAMSTFSTPLTCRDPPHFSRWFSKSGKKSNYHFLGLMSQTCKSTTFGHQISDLSHFDVQIWQNPQKHRFCSKMTLFSEFSSQNPL